MSSTAWATSADDLPSIYFGGATENGAGLLVNDKVGAEMLNEDVIFMGADSIYDNNFVNLLPEKGQDSVQQYEKRFGSGIMAFDHYSYEAANILLGTPQRAKEEGYFSLTRLSGDIIEDRDFG